MTSSMGVMAAEAAKVGSVVTAIARRPQVVDPRRRREKPAMVANWQTPGVSRSEALTYCRHGDLQTCEPCCGRWSILAMRSRGDAP